MNNNVFGGLFAPIIERKDGVTTFYLNPCELEKWMYQNKADYTGDYFEGCLLDNFIVSTKNGIAAIYEHYVNSNQSDYLVKFGRDREGRFQVYDEFTETGLRPYEDE